MLIKTLDGYPVDTDYPVAPQTHGITKLLALLGRYRQQRNRYNTMVNGSHDSSPQHARIPMRVWRRRSAMLMLLNGESDEV
jgi:hypothetical protein